MKKIPQNLQKKRAPIVKNGKKTIPSERKKGKEEGQFGQWRDSPPGEKMREWNQCDVEPLARGELFPANGSSPLAGGGG